MCVYLCTPLIGRKSCLCHACCQRDLCSERGVCAAQPSFIGAFGLSKADLPTLVAFHPKKLRGASLRASFSAESIDALLDGLFSGSIHSEAFQELPALVEGGEDDSAEMDLVEEEFDLADVLGEDVGGSRSKEDLLKQAEIELQVCRSINHAHHAGNWHPTSIW